MKIQLMIFFLIKTMNLFQKDKLNIPNKILLVFHSLKKSNIFIFYNINYIYKNCFLTKN